MEDLEHKISEILGDPQAMAGILSMAQSLGLGGAPDDGKPSDTAPDPEAGPFGLPQSVADLLSEAGKLNGKQTALLKALRPFLRENRREKLDRAIQAARISHIAGYAIRTLGNQEQGR